MASTAASMTSTLTSSTETPIHPHARSTLQDGDQHRHHCHQRSGSAQRIAPTVGTSVGSSIVRSDGKEALCRAMGVLFLQHRVDKLQSDVDELESSSKQGKCGKRLTSGWKGGRWKQGCPYGRKDDREGTSPVVLQTSPAKVIDALDRKEDDASSQLSSLLARDNGKAGRLVVADVSLLIYSLRTVHNWLKEGDCRIVVPMETLRTLDVLKKGDHYLNLAARKATRFLDERFLTGSQVGDEDGLAPGLVAQKEGEKVSLAEWKKIESAVRETKGLGSEVDEESIRQLPHTVRRTLSCSLYFMQDALIESADGQGTLTSNKERPAVSLALALPPPHFDASDEADLKYCERADGSFLLQRSRQLGLDSSSLIVAPTAASWLTADANSKDTR